MPPSACLPSHPHRRRSDILIESMRRLYKGKSEGAFGAVSTENQERTDAPEIAFNLILCELQLNLLLFVFALGVLRPCVRT